MMPDAPQPPSMQRVFVYGTLRAGGSNDITRYRPQPHWVGPGWVLGTLYDLGSYPGLRLGGAEHVVGEIYEVEADVALAIDVLEEIAPDDSGEYIKRRVQVESADGKVDCWLYEIHPSRLFGRTPIGGGDWIAHLPARQ